MASVGLKLEQMAWPGVVGPGGVGANLRAGHVPAEGAVGFAETLKAALGEVNATLLQGDAAVRRLATGEAASLQEVVLAMERANLALQFTMAIRNKLLEAYNELMRMPV
jgi:flagellar hook-basal body complex protein FliE